MHVVSSDSSSPPPQCIPALLLGLPRFILQSTSTSTVSYPLAVRRAVPCHVLQNLESDGVHISYFMLFWCLRSNSLVQDYKYSSCIPSCPSNAVQCQPTPCFFSLFNAPCPQCPDNPVTHIHTRIRAPLVSNSMTIFSENEHTSQQASGA